MKHALNALAAAIVLTACATAEDTPGWSTMVDADTARIEFAALYDGLQSAHYDLYVNRSEVAYDSQFSTTMEAINEPVSRFELFLAFQKFAAFGNVAHARLEFPSEVYDAYRENGGKAFPIYLRIVDGRAYVGEDYTGLDEVTPGDEILAIDATPMSAWLERTAQYLSADTDYIAHSMLEFSFPMYLWVDAGPRDEFDVQLKGAAGDTKDITIPALSRAALMAATEENATSESSETPMREAKMLNTSIAYLKPGPFYNAEAPEKIWDTTSFVAFIDEAFADFIARDAQSLIIDLRGNPGGDNSFSDPMIAWIADRPFRFASKFLIKSSDEAAASNQARLDANPGAVEGISHQFAKAYEATPRGETFEFDIPFTKPRQGARFQGDVYVLINRHSYSNAVNVASIFQDYGWGHIAGEKTADMATTYGAMEQFILPETGFSVGFPKAHIIRPSGDERVDGVTPDIAIEFPVVSTDEDDVLSRLITIVEGG